jgi:hypothetical protein
MGGRTQVGIYIWITGGTKRRPLMVGGRIHWGIEKSYNNGILTNLFQALGH